MGVGTFSGLGGSKYLNPGVDGQAGPDPKSAWVKPPAHPRGWGLDISITKFVNLCYDISHKGKNEGLDPAKIDRLIMPKEQNCGIFGGNAENG